MLFINSKALHTRILKLSFSHLEYELIDAVSDTCLHYKSCKRYCFNQVKRNEAFGIKIIALNQKWICSTVERTRSKMRSNYNKNVSIILILIESYQNGVRPQTFSSWRATFRRSNSKFRLSFSNCASWNSKRKLGLLRGFEMLVFGR